MKFSTIDSDNDLRSGLSCAATYNSGWWFNGKDKFSSSHTLLCLKCNLNGVYNGTGGTKYHGIKWRTFKNQNLKETKMMIRR